MSSDVSPEHLLNSLYSMSALANYYLYNEHNGEKAREILLSSKKLAEQYVINKSPLKDSFTFDKLNKKEIYNELSIIKDLPEIYTGIIYFLARTYLYQGNKADGIAYFELSKYLGEKLKLFEGYLSERSGLGVIIRKLLEQDIANKTCTKEQVIEKINESVKLYQKLKNDVTEYKEGYKPRLC